MPHSGCSRYPSTSSFLGRMHCTRGGFFPHSREGVIEMEAVILRERTRKEELPRDGLYTRNYIFYLNVRTHTRAHACTYSSIKGHIHAYGFIEGQPTASTPRPETLHRRELLSRTGSSPRPFAKTAATCWRATRREIGRPPMPAPAAPT